MYNIDLDTICIRNVNETSNEPEITVNDLTDIEMKALYNAKELLSDISVQIGDTSKRRWNTRISKVPKTKDVISVNKIVHMLLVEIKDVLNSNNYEHILWLLDCVIYAAIISWYLQNGIKCENKIKTQTQRYNPKWLTKLEQEIKELCKLISQGVSEIDRLKKNGRLTRKSKRNTKMFEECIGYVSIYGLTKLIMKSKARIHRLAKVRKKKLAYDEARNLNNLFRNNQGRVFSKFRDSINSQKDEEFPVYKETKNM